MILPFPPFTIHGTLSLGFLADIYLLAFLAPVFSPLRIFPPSPNPTNIVAGGGGVALAQVSWSSRRTDPSETNHHFCMMITYKIKIKREKTGTGGSDFRVTLNKSLSLDIWILRYKGQEVIVSFLPCAWEKQVLNETMKDRADTENGETEKSNCWCLKLNLLLIVSPWFLLSSASKGRMWRFWVRASWTMGKA